MQRNDIRLSTWKNDEFGYCLHLVGTRGNTNVPVQAVASYLDTQIVSARRDGRDDVVSALVDLRIEWVPYAALAVALDELRSMNRDLRAIGKGRPEDGAHPDCAIHVVMCALTPRRG